MANLRLQTITFAELLRIGWTNISLYIIINNKSIQKLTKVPIQEFPRIQQISRKVHFFNIFCRKHCEAETPLRMELHETKNRKKTLCMRESDPGTCGSICFHDEWDV